MLQNLKKKVKAIVSGANSKMKPQRGENKRISKPSGNFSFFFHESDWKRTTKNALGHNKRERETQENKQKAMRSRQRNLEFFK